MARQPDVLFIPKPFTLDQLAAKVREALPARARSGHGTQRRRGRDEQHVRVDPSCR